MPGAFDFEARSLKGEPVPLSRYSGRVLLIVNTASRCGFTPQYRGLQQLHEKYHERGLSVLAFPCNQFGHQEPGTAEEIGSFCETNYHVGFDLFDKVDVNGEYAHPLWRWLTEEARGVLGTRVIKWNFTKFLVGRDGGVVHRYAPTTVPAQIERDIETQLARPV